ncbi:MAG: hypothetical protein AB1585_15575 [Thermodesulfobacteriota bacterium]
MLKFLILIILNSALMFREAMAWTGEKIIPPRLPGLSISEPVSLLLLGVTLVSLWLIGRKIDQKIMVTIRRKNHRT